MFSLRGLYVIRFRRFSIKDFGSFESWPLKEEVLQMSALKANKDNWELHRKETALEELSLSLLTALVCCPFWQSCGGGVLLIGEKGEAWIRNDLLSGKSKPLKRGSLVCCRAVLSYTPTHVPPSWPFCSINRKSSSCLLRGKTQTLHVHLPSAEQRKCNFLRLFTRTVWRVLPPYSGNSKFPLLALSNK